MWYGEEYSEPRQTPKMEPFTEILNSIKPLTMSIFYKKLLHFKCLIGA